MKIYCISDCHIKFKENEEATQRRRRVESFLETIECDADVLILNGDIFDLWFSWETVIIRGYFSFLFRLKKLKENGTRILFLSGNHDFWFNKFLENEMGIEVYEQDCSILLDGKKFFISHGDLYTKNDLQYKIFRNIIRNSFLKFCFALLHPAISLNIGRLMSRSSRNRKRNNHTKKKKKDGLKLYAFSKLEHYDIVLFGHSHSPKIENMGDKYYCNSGDWIVHDSFIKIEDGIPMLEIFTAE